MRTPHLCALALALGLAVAVVGCGGGGGSSSSSSSGGGVDTQAPSITSSSVSPASLDFRGGLITIRADATDISGVQSVVANVQKQGGTASQVTMNLSSGNTYQGTLSLTANQSGLAETYTVTVLATDTRSNATSPVTAGSVSVAAPDDTVPPPPVFPN